MKHKKQIVIAASAVVLIILIIVIRNSFTNHEYPYVRVQKGIFESTIETIGELYATSSTDIEIPAAARNEAVNVRQFKIIDIIQEGSIVKKGDERTYWLFSKIEPYLHGQCLRLESNV